MDASGLPCGQSLPLQEQERWTGLPSD